MTSALSDACAWSVGKLKTSAEDWRTGMRLWRPERELAAGHLCIALFTRFFDGMLHAALDPVHGTRKAAIERKARRLQQQAAAQARSEGETRRQPSPRAQRREAQQKEWLQRRERQRRELEAETAERQLEATRQRRQRWQDDAPSPTKSMLKAEGTEARSYDDRGAQELAVVVQRGDEADAAIAWAAYARMVAGQGQGIIGFSRGELAPRLQPLERKQAAQGAIHVEGASPVATEPSRPAHTCRRGRRRRRRRWRAQARGVARPSESTLGWCELRPFAHQVSEPDAQTLADERR